MVAEIACGHEHIWPFAGIPDHWRRLGCFGSTCFHSRQLAAVTSHLILVPLHHSIQLLDYCIMPSQAHLCQYIHSNVCVHLHMAPAIQGPAASPVSWLPRTHTIINRHDPSSFTCTYSSTCKPLVDPNQVLLSVHNIVFFPLSVSCICAMSHMLDHVMLVCRNFYKMDLGPKPGVSLRVAVLAEGILTYLLNLVILYATSEFPNSILHTTWVQTAACISNSHAEMQH